ncbi:MAG: hypothetical protein N4A72_06530 [Bacteroidales bacterium]|jgi:hypothetical protein|nr:hypothetical protein [Bacteroidales bacterium]
MKKLLTLTPLLIIFMIPGFSQLRNYKLSDYHPPQYELLKIDLKTNIEGSNFANNYKYESDSKVKNRENTFRGMLIADSYYEYYSPLRQDMIGSLIRADFNFTNEEKGSNDYEESALNRMLDVYGDHLRYFTSNKFWGLSYRLSTNYSEYTRTDNNPVGNLNGNKAKTENDYFRIYFSLPLSVGKGRVEDVSNAVRAMFMIHQLQKAGYISGDITDEKITNLADKLVKLENTRFFDSRIKRMDDFVAVDSLLREEGLVTSRKASYFAELSDQWMYTLPRVNSGKKLYTSFEPAIRYRNVHTEFDDESLHVKNNPATLLFHQTVTYEYYKPVNMNLSWGYIVYGGAGIYAGNNKKEKDDSYVIPDIFLRTVGKVKYIPSTRSKFEAEANVKYTHFFDFIEGGDNNNKGYLITSGISFNGYYYLSPRIRIQGTTNLAYNFTKSDLDFKFTHYPDEPIYNPNNSEYNWYRDNKFNFNFNLGVVYKFK